MRPLANPVCMGYSRSELMGLQRGKSKLSAERKGGGNEGYGCEPALASSDRLKRARRPTIKPGPISM